MNKILIVGGGNAGLITALILKTKFPQKQIDLVASKAIGTVGVGEGSTEHWREFMRFVGLDIYEVMRETNSALKYGVLYDGWADKPFYHCVQDPYNVKFGQHRSLYAKLIGEGAEPTEFLSKITQANLVDEYFLNNPDVFPCNQFNFNTFKLVDYLSKVAQDRGINIVDDIITDVQLDERGYIKSLKSETRSYDYDFYIDSTGFRRVLMNKLGAKWVSHSKYLKMKSVMVFPSPAEEEIPLFILSKAMDYGWYFKIAINNRFGNGYIYDSDYISQDQAKDELDKFKGYDVQIGQHIKFDPGALEKVWINNCCAIGLSGSFIEPLEASSIGSTIHQAFLLMHRLENYNQHVIDSYNRSCNSMIENIRDYIVLHYLTKKKNTQFWIDAADITLPDSLQTKLELWREHLPIQEDFSNQSDYILYNDVNHILIMQGLGLFNQKAIAQEYEASSPLLKQEVDRILEQQKYNDLNSRAISHKEFLKQRSVK